MNQTINRQRIKPRIWDYSYLLLKNNLTVFKLFRDLIIKENKIKLLDVGCGYKPWLLMFDKEKVEYIGVDFDKENSSADFIMTADELHFPDNHFDGLIYSEVLEHFVNLSGVLKEMRRVAKPGALVFISSPFIFPEHGIPYDFQRPTQYFYIEIFRQDEIIIIKPSNSSLSTALTTLNLFIESSPFRILLGLKHLIYVLTNVLALFADFIINLVFLKIGKSYWKYFYLMPLGYALVIRIKK